MHFVFFPIVELLKNCFSYLHYCWFSQCCLQWSSWAFWEKKIGQNIQFSPWFPFSPWPRPVVLSLRAMCEDKTFSFVAVLSGPSTSFPLFTPCSSPFFGVDSEQRCTTGVVWSTCQLRIPHTLLPCLWSRLFLLLSFLVFHFIWRIMKNCSCRPILHKLQGALETFSRVQIRPVIFVERVWDVKSEHLSWNTGLTPTRVKELLFRIGRPGEMVVWQRVVLGKELSVLYWPNIVRFHCL